jgi:hypothetical protein
MRCVVHVRKSLDFAGQHFVLRLFPLYASDSEEQRLVETFTSEESLSRRLMGIGLPKTYVAATFSNLNSDSDAMWTNVEIAQGDFEHFGKATDRQPDDWPQIAA